MPVLGLGGVGTEGESSMARVQHTGLNLSACPFPEPLPWPREQMRFSLLPPASGSWHTLVLCQDLRIPSHLMIQVPAFVSTGAGCSRHELISKHPGVITRGQRRGNDAMQGLRGKCLRRRPTAHIPHSPSPAHTGAPSLDPLSWASLNPPSWLSTRSPAPGPSLLFLFSSQDPPPWLSTRSPAPWSPPPIHYFPRRNNKASSSPLWHSGTPLYPGL